MHQFSLALQDLSHTEQTNFFTEIYEEMQADFNPTVLDKLAQAKESHDVVVILSGAYTPFLKIIAKALNIGHYIGTDLPEFGQKTDHIHSARKVSKLAEAFGDQTIDWQNSIAYADSASDIRLLEKVGTAIAVSPDKTLSAHAHKHQWYIIS